MRLLLAEDEKELARAVATMLEMSGYEVDVAHDGLRATELAAENAYGCMVLDIMMPKMTGTEALKAIRESGNVTPVVMLTAKSEIEDRVAGLEAGADDYLTKPFSMKELLARVRSQTRRNEVYAPRELSLGSVTLDVDHEQLRCVNSISLANRETRLMRLFLMNPERELTTREIFEQVWDDDPEADETLVWVYVSYLRNKLQSIAADIEICGERGGSFHVQVAAQPVH